MRESQITLREHIDGDDDGKGKFEGLLGVGKQKRMIIFAPTWVKCSRTEGRGYSIWLEIWKGHFSKEALGFSTSCQNAIYIAIDKQKIYVYKT